MHSYLRVAVYVYPMSLFNPGIFLRGTIISRQRAKVRAVIMGTPMIELTTSPVNVKPKKKPVWRA